MGLAKLIAWLGITASVVLGLVLVYNGAQSWYSGDAMTLSGLGVMVGGSIISWISSWFVYGYGRLIDNSDQIRHHMERITQSGMTQPILPIVSCPNNE